MRVKVSYRGQTLELEFEGERVRVGELLKALGLSREYAFVVKGEDVLEEKDTIVDGESVRVINAISGGYI
ncbi:thiamine biosynthesis protein ThiS [Hydrogenobacter sp. T-2]|uniref:thiamine biosynthesis protein ThiS n=1 Tax=Pampinifervens diazotrophicum TaxID=1632018 RepID=UPI002B25A61F|nr:thiamine biosynthesis protein ThiS [Hydrogenobacter sp. T-2]WPM32539.1 thiamine biosynthesis protein ThiS [Hydrogenobacter sp. T-2]